ncbi:MAG TPA: class I SAM-dependent methyltransferase [Candidatus Sulfotelmatobacter sp.]|nr:class I SAM-dependent methyltransferase [Candidatus Sulfotelmatobacter sp.]
MSRLDAFIKRVTAQRDCLNEIARRIADRPGPILELGLGNGRTYDHLRGLFPDREIYVFDREIAAHPSCIPPAGLTILGDFRDTLGTALARIGPRAVLAHGDFGSGDPVRTAALAAFLGPALDPLMAAGGYVVSDQRMSVARWRPVAPPATVEPDRYYVWQVGDAA